MTPFGYENKEFEKSLDSKPFDKKYKKVIEVDVVYRKSGTMYPIKIYIECLELPISKVLNIRKGKSLKTTMGESLRYTVIIKSQVIYLFFDVLDKLWYIELTENAIIFYD